MSSFFYLPLQIHDNLVTACVRKYLIVNSGSNLKPVDLVSEHSTTLNMAPTYILNYFPIAGRAEVARLMFHVAEVEFTDNQLPIADWPKHKSDGMCKTY